MRTGNELRGWALCWRMTQIDLRAMGLSARERERVRALSAGFGELLIRQGTLRLLHTYGRRRSVKGGEIKRGQLLLTA